MFSMLYIVQCCILRVFARQAPQRTHCTSIANWWRYREATPRQHRGGTAYWHCLLDKKALWSSTYKRRALFYAPFFQNNFTMQNLHCEFSLPTMPDCPNSSSLLGLRVWVRPVEFSNFADCELLHSNAVIFGVVGSLTKFENLNSPHTSFTCLRPCYRW